MMQSDSAAKERYYAVGFFHTPDGDSVLLHLRGPDTLSAPNQWALFGGGSEAVDGGDPAATWRREVREEFGVALAPEQVRSVLDYVYLGGLRRHVFCAEWPAQTLDFVLTEGRALGWFTLEEALAHPDVTKTTKTDLTFFRDGH
jgi:8-oxo-dGTP pyrophosphatase MutT (NUDIX family)